MRIGICLKAGVLPITLLMLWQGSEQAAASSEACRSLAAIYARAPEQMDAQERMALQNCVATEAEEKSGTAQPSAPSSQDISVAPDPQSGTAPEQERAWGEWPLPPAWTEHWPSSNPW